MTLSINDTQHNTICHYAECCYAKCRDFCIAMLNVVMLNVVMLNVVMLSVVQLNDITLNAVMLNVVAPKTRSRFTPVSWSLSSLSPSSNGEHYTLVGPAKHCYSCKVSILNGEEIVKKKLVLPLN
jgi:hypothetical protein